MVRARRPSDIKKTPAEILDKKIQETIATPFTRITANILAEIRSNDFPEMQKDEFLEFVKRNLEEYNKLVLESLGDKL